MKKWQRGGLVSVSWLEVTPQDSYWTASVNCKGYLYSEEEITVKERVSVTG